MDRSRAGDTPLGTAIAWGILAAGFALRVAALMLARGNRWATAEAGQAAIGFARTGYVSDAYMPGQGPTAHLNPILPAFAGTVYRLFGVRSPTSEAILATVAIGVAILSFWFLYRAFGRLGVPQWARLAGLLACCFLPLFQGLENTEFRIWEGGLAVLLAAIFLDALLAVDADAGPVTFARIVGIALLAALLLFVSPILGLAAYAAAAICIVTTIAPRRWPAILAIATVMLAAILLPWTIRNDRLLGVPVVLRSNPGLELGMGYDPAALRAPDRGQALVARERAIHPYGNPAVYAELQARGGEVAYARYVGDRTKRWIIDHPRDAALLTLIHTRDFLFPPTWSVRLHYASSDLMRAVRQALLWSLSLLGIIGGVIALRSRRRAWLYPILFWITPVMMYSIVTPNVRYYYVIFGLNVFFATLVLATVAARWRSGRARA